MKSYFFSFLPCALLALTACQGINTDTEPDASPTPSGSESPAPSPTPTPNPVKLHVAGFGDSVTDGFCSTAGHDYVSLLIDNDDALYPEWTGKDLTSHFESVTLTNGAVSGSTSCDYTANGIRSYIQDYLANNPFDADLTAVVITLGGNDLIEPYGCSGSSDCAAFCSTAAQAAPWSDNYEARMIEFLNVFKQEIPGNVELFIATIYDPTDEVGDIENADITSGGQTYNLPAWPDGPTILDMYNAKVANIATATGAHVVDMRSAMLGHGIHHDDPSNPYYDASDPTYWYCQNLEDPNDLGYHAIRQAFWNEIATTLGLE